MTSFIRPLLIASLLAAAGVSAQAQGMGGPQSGPMGQHHRMDPARMQDTMATRQADLKAKLKLTAAQEAAWTAFTTSVQPPADMASRMGQGNRQKMHDDMAKLTTPERIDQMQAMKTQRDAAMTKRHDATKAFYAALTPEQQKAFDANTLGRHHGVGQGDHGGPGMHLRHNG